MNIKERRLSFCALYSGIVYLLWLLTVVDTPLGIVFFVCECMVFGLFVIFFVNHITQKYQLFGGSYSLRSVVDIYIPTKNEPLSMVRNTIIAAQNIEHANTRIYVIDDGNRANIAQLCEELSVTYLVRPDWNVREYKARALNYALKNSYGVYILTIDADQIVEPRILDHLLGHFQDARVGLVATKQQFRVSAENFNNDHIFYDHMQSGKNTEGVGISCGSGVIYRRSALEEIGGFQEWNIVEDLYTSFILNTYGYISIYTNQSFSTGEAPDDLKTIYKQRFIWALDTLRLFVWKQPLFNSALTWSQRLHYFEMGYIYIVSGIAVPVLFLTTCYSLLSHTYIIDTGSIYLLLRVPSFIFVLWIYHVLGKGSASSRMWAALYPVYFWALIRALLFIRPRKYSPTIKGKKARSRLLLTLPQSIFIALAFFSLCVSYMQHGIDSLLLTNIFWIIVMTYWFSAVYPIAIAVKEKVNT